MKFDLKSIVCGIIIGSVGVTTVFAAGNIKSAMFNTNSVVFNGKRLDLSKDPMISIVKDGQTNISNYMPVRSILEQMGYIVDWNGATNTVIVNDKNYKAEAPDKNTPSSKSLEEQVVDLVNEQRALAGLPSLKYSQEITDVAYLKAKDIVDNNYFDHISPTYGSPFDMMQQFNIKYSTAGENIAQGYKTPKAAVDGWMNSEGHRANILNGDYDEIGVGIYADSNGVITWVQMFIKRR